MALTIEEAIQKRKDQQALLAQEIDILRAAQKIIDGEPLVQPNPNLEQPVKRWP